MWKNWKVTGNRTQVAGIPSFSTFLLQPVCSINIRVTICSPGYIEPSIFIGYHVAHVMMLATLVAIFLSQIMKVCSATSSFKMHAGTNISIHIIIIIVIIFYYYYHHHVPG